MNSGMAIETKDAPLSDEEVVHRVRNGETALFEILVRRYNQRLYRVARAILGDDSEAEDVVQEAHVRAYQHLNQFTGQAKYSTWLTKIAAHEALARARRRDRFVAIDSVPEPNNDTMTARTSKQPTPEQQALVKELRGLLEASINALPETYRLVFMLREIEGMSTVETAESLGITEETVKTRLHRAKALLRRELFARAGVTSTEAFQFGCARCNRVVAAVFERIKSPRWCT